MSNNNEYRVELASGVDTLYLSSRPNVPHEFYRDLLNLKTQAQLFNHDQLPYEIAGECFEVLDRSLNKYQIWLRHQFGNIGITQSKSLPGVYIQISAEYLHSVGAQAATQWFVDIFSSKGIETKFTISRVDLHMDIQGWDLSQNQTEFFTCRATKLNVRSSDNLVSGYEFGLRKSKTILCRIYNKSLQIREESKARWTKEIWNEKYNPELDVWRIEFEFHTEYFRQVGIHGIEDLAKLPNLWASATHDWLTHRSPSEDSNKSRWANSPEWTFIQSCSFAFNGIPLERISARKKFEDLRGLLVGARGYLAAIGAHSSSETIEECGKYFLNLMTTFELHASRPFEEVVIEKRMKLDRY